MKTFLSDAHLHLPIASEYVNIFELFGTILKTDDYYLATSAHSIKEYRKQKEIKNILESEYNNILIFQSFGVHPQNEESDFGENLRFLKETLETGGLDYIGEVGFDRYTNEYKKTLPFQISTWEAELSLAIKYEKPLLIHARKSIELVYRYLKELRKVPRVIFHSFSGNAIEAAHLHEKLPEAFFSFGTGVLKGAKKQIECVKALPLDFLLFETDAPFQTLRGEPFTSPLRIIDILDKALEIRNEAGKNVGKDEFRKVIKDNFLRAFRVA